MWTSTGGYWVVSSLVMVGVAAFEVWEVRSLAHSRGSWPIGGLGTYGHRVGNEFWGTFESHVDGHIRVISRIT